MTKKTEDDAVAFVERFLKTGVLHDFINRKATSRTQLEDHKNYDLEDKVSFEDTNDYDMMIALSVDILRSGDRMPIFYASFAADVLEGKRVRPTKRGVDPYKNWVPDFNLWRAAEEVKEKYGFPLYTNNELAKKVTAAEIVSRGSGSNLNAVKNAIRKMKDWKLV